MVVVGGLGSLKGSLVGSLIIGQAETFGKAWLPGVVDADDLRRDGRSSCCSAPGALRPARSKMTLPRPARRSALAWLALRCSPPLLPARSPGNYPVKLLQEILIWGIFAMSLDLLMGYAGMVSFGHSAFFGVGGYVAALALAKSARAGLGALAAARAGRRRSPRSSSASSRSG